MRNDIADQIIDLDLALSFSGTGQVTATDSIELPAQSYDALVFDVAYSGTLSTGSWTNVANLVSTITSELFCTSTKDNVRLFNLNSTEMATYAPFCAATERPSKVTNEIRDDSGISAGTTVQTGEAQYVMYHPIDKSDKPKLEMTIDGALFPGCTIGNLTSWSVTVNVGAIAGPGGRKIMDTFTESATTTNNVVLPGFPVKAALIKTTTSRDLTRIAFKRYSLDSPNLIVGQWSALTEGTMEAQISDVAAAYYFMVPNESFDSGSALRVDGSTSEARTFWFQSPRHSTSTSVGPTAGRPVTPSGPSGLRPGAGFGNIRLNLRRE